MNLVIDRINNDIAVCQDIDTRMMFEIDVKSLGFEVHDGDIISLVDGKYVLNNDLKEERIKIIEEKLNRAKNN
jgi:hypothetical protein